MRAFIITLAATVLALGVLLSTFIVGEADLVLVVRMGDPVRAISEPGLALRIPFVDVLQWLDRRLLTSDQDSQSFTTKDKKRVKIDYVIRWRIDDPILFYPNLNNIRNASLKLDNLVRGLLQEEIAGRNFSEHSADDDRENTAGGGVIGANRKIIMTRVTQMAEKVAHTEYGIEVTDVRMKRLDLPKEVEESVFDRMRAERERIARKYRAEGAKEAREIKAEARKQVQIILAEGYEESETLLGKGEAEAARIYAEAYEPGAEFYAFMKRLETYESVFKNRSSLVLDSGSPLFRLLEDPTAFDLEP